MRLCDFNVFVADTRGAVIVSLQDARANQGQQTRRDLQFFESRLGLRIEKRKGTLLACSQPLFLPCFLESGAIEFIFTYIDQNRPSAEYCITILVDSSNLYHVLQVSPFIGNLEEETKELNATNDLGKFLKRVRQLFVANASAL